MMRAAICLAVASLFSVQDVSGVRPKDKDVETQGDDGHLRHGLALGPPLEVEDRYQMTTTPLPPQMLMEKIRWLQDFGGTDKVIVAIVKNICGRRLVKANTAEEAMMVLMQYAIGLVDNTTENQLDDKVLKTLEGNVPYLVHSSKQSWTYHSTHSPTTMNSYSMGHQRSETHPFSQSFAQLYMLDDRCPDGMFGGNPETTPRSLFNELKETKFADNIKVIVEYWKAVFSQLEKTSKGWTLKTLKNINKELGYSFKLASDDAKINFEFVQERLKDIAEHANAIAMYLGPQYLP